MKHRSKKKSHVHGKHHKHKSSAAPGDDPEAPQVASSLSPRIRATANGNGKMESTGSRRGSMCEFCGAPTSTADGMDDDMFDCADDCERFASIDIDAVTCPDAYQLRSPHLTAFYCQCGCVIGELQSFFRVAGTTDSARSAFSERFVLQIRPKLLALFSGMWRLGVGRGGYMSAWTSAAAAPSFDPEDDGDDCVLPRGPTCPFVMVLSVLLPALHKFLEFTQRTKPHWWLGNNASCTVAGAVELLATQLQLHDLLGHVVAEGDRLAILIEENEERDQDITSLVQPLARTPGRSGADSSSSASSVSSQSRPGSATDHDPVTRTRLPQIRRISFEFEEWLAESKYELAELSEAMLENVEITALRLSRFPPLGIVTDAASKAKSSANEFVEALMKNVLVPLSDRVVSTPSTSRSYIFPRIVDRCVCVAMDEHIGDNNYWTAEKASQFERAIELFRTWGISVDAVYDKQLINAPRDIARLGLLSMDAFRRLDILLHSWVRHGKDGEPYVPRLTFRTNLENLRTTFKRTMTARTHGQLQATSTGLSGVATPPPEH